MFWLFVAFLAITVLNYLLHRPAKSQTPPPGELTPPEVPAGTPIPVPFGTVKMQPIVVAFDYHLRPVVQFQSTPFGSTSQVLAYRRIVTLTGLIGWGPMTFSEIIFNDSKKLTAQGGQAYITSANTSSIPPSFTTATTSSGGFSFGGFPNPATQSYGYGEIYLPQLFGGDIPPGSGGIRGDWDYPQTPTLPCQANRFAPGGKIAFFMGGDVGTQAHGIQPPIDDIKNFGGVPTDGDCNPTPTTSGPGRIRYPRFGYIWEGDFDQGTSPQLAKQEFVIDARVYGQSGPGNLDTNPIGFLLAVLTDQEWGLGISEGLVDLDNFSTVAGGTAFEGFGISGVLAQQQAGDQVIGEILRTVDAVLFRHPATGLISTQLIRGGYVLADLPSLDETNIVSLDWTRREIADTSNQVTIAYTDRDRNWTRNVVSLTDHANVFATGSVRSIAFEFPYISTETWALKVGARELKGASLPLGKGTVTVTRWAWDAVPGDVFRLNFARYGLVDVPVRVLSMNSGDLDNGSIELEIVEDLFGLPDVPYTVDSGTWTDPGASNLTAPVVSVAQSDDGVTGQASLFIQNDSVVTLVEFSTQSGRDIPSGFGSVSGGPSYDSPSVDLSATAPSYIYWRVTYTVSGGTAQISGTVTFSVSGSGSTSGSGSQIVINDGLGGFVDVFDSTADEVVTG